ncbi:SusC/RagA family TonB-linked outer membrane protein, partial [Sphingobacterium shayense]|uniref:carboxypeptidase-like regulatory domain-containing protein n=1 Tax=Sphingobacterium shayense TaxID=626343 RepID=UPI0015548F15
MLQNAVVMMLLMLVSSAAWAQSIRGSVVFNATNQPVVGASVSVKGSQRATSTNEQGDFSIQAAVGDILVITYLGFDVQEIAAKNDLIIRLEENTSDLEEVVVIGYGTQKKKLNTGANLRVEGEDLEKRNQLNPLQAMQGQAPGVSISSTSGQPGASMKVVV